MMKVKKYAKYLLDKNNGDIAMTMKVVRNAAVISSEEGDDEAFNRESETFQALEVMQAKKAS